SVIVRFRGDQRQRIKSGRLVVIGIALVDLPHGSGVGLSPRFVIQFLTVRIERLQGGDVIALTSGPSLWLFSLLQLLGSTLDAGGVRLIPELVPQTEGH